MNRVRLQSAAIAAGLVVADCQRVSQPLSNRGNAGVFGRPVNIMKIPYLIERGTPLASLPWGRRLRAPFVRQLRRAHRQFRVLPPGSYRRIVDVGVCYGEFTDLARKYFEPEKIWMVEADPELAANLKEKYRSASECEVTHAAITDRTGELTFQVNEHRPSSSVLPIAEHTGRVFNKSMNELRSVTVPSLSLDDYFDRHGIESVDLMKIDIQGAEKLLIQGGQRALQKVRLVHIELMFEACYTGCALFGELDPLMRAAGFKLRALDDFRRGSDGGLAYCNGLYWRPEDF